LNQLLKHLILATLYITEFDSYLPGDYISTQIMFFPFWFLFYLNFRYFAI